MNLLSENHYNVFRLEKYGADELQGAKNDSSRPAWASAYDSELYVYMHTNTPKRKLFFSLQAASGHIEIK